jgi:hypothetical protein
MHGDADAAWDDLQGWSVSCVTGKAETLWRFVLSGRFTRPNDPL